MATRSLEAELARRRPSKSSSGEPLTFLGVLSDEYFSRARVAAGIKFPSPRYREDPVAHSRDILGIQPWAKQGQILMSLVPPRARVSVRSGHKIGKSSLAAQAAFWFYDSFDAARVIMTSTTARQVNEILWRECRMQRAKSGRCVDCVRALLEDPTLRIPKPCPHSALIDGEMGDTATTGLKSDDFREITGFTAKQAEAVQGISGANILYIIDEASGVLQEIYEGIEGNRAGGVRVLLLGNPTKNSGEHFDSFHAKQRFYSATFTISSEESPNVAAGKEVIPGLATKEWIDEKREEWGEKSALFKVRCKGEHATHEEGKIFSLHDIAIAEQRWDDTPAEGRLYIGIDPAGASGRGDEIMFVPRRGLKVLKFRPFRGLDEVGHLGELLRMIGELAHPRETPVVVVDSEGDVGSKVYSALREYRDAHEGSYELVRIRASDRALRQPEVYHLMRDALAASLASWFAAGGAIPEDAKLERELHEFEWRQRADGKLKLTPDKETMRKLIGRSPDRFDGLSLACWEPLALREENETPPTPAPQQDAYHQQRPALDPYAGSSAWGRR